MGQWVKDRIQEIKKSRIKMKVFIKLMMMVTTTRTTTTTTIPTIPTIPTLLILMIKKGNNKR